MKLGQAIVLCGLCVLGGVVCSPAAEPAAEDYKFRANEFTVDLFGTGSLGENTLENISGERVEQDIRLGGGVGGAYYFHRNIGLGADTYTENAGHSFMDDVQGSLYLRLPIETISLAPYALGGGGYQFDPIEQWFWNLGGGVEFRFTRSIGIFVDARYVFTDRSDDFGLGRLGLRLAF